MISKDLRAEKPVLKRECPEFVRLSLEGKTFDQLNTDWSLLAVVLDFSVMGDDPYAVISDFKVIRMTVSGTDDVELHYKYSWQLFHACRDYRESSTTTAVIRGRHYLGAIMFPVFPRAVSRSTVDEF